jgi:hypothetical protein
LECLGQWEIQHISTPGSEEIAISKLLDNEDLEDPAADDLR